MDHNPSEPLPHNPMNVFLHLKKEPMMLTVTKTWWCTWDLWALLSAWELWKAAIASSRRWLSPLRVHILATHCLNAAARPGAVRSKYKALNFWSFLSASMYKQSLEFFFSSTLQMCGFQSTNTLKGTKLFWISPFDLSSSICQPLKYWRYIMVGW